MEKWNVKQEDHIDNVIDMILKNDSLKESFLKIWLIKWIINWCLISDRIAYFWYEMKFAISISKIRSFMQEYISLHKQLNSGFTINFLNLDRYPDLIKKIMFGDSFSKDDFVILNPIVTRMIVTKWARSYDTWTEIDGQDCLGVRNDLFNDNIKSFVYLNMRNLLLELYNEIDTKTRCPNLSLIIQWLKRDLASSMNWWWHDSQTKKSPNDWERIKAIWWLL